MNRAVFLFKFIDIFGTPLQNLRHVGGITRVRDIAYDTSHDRQKLDVWYRTGDEAKKKPVIFFIHGGGFVAGSKNFRKNVAQLYASYGFAVVTVNHRLSPEFVFPTPVFDCVNALNFLPQIAERFNLDLSTVITSGDSSGGYFTCYITAAAYNAQLRERLGLPDIQVLPTGFIGLCGAYDSIKLFSAKVPFGFARVTGESFLGMKLRRDFSNLAEYEYLDCFTPLDYIDENWVPSCIVYSAKDLFCRGQGERFLELLQKYNIPHTEYHVSNFVENHDFQLFAFNPHSGRAFAAVHDFLDRFLAGEFVRKGANVQDTESTSEQALEE